jgi:hypothetical protein
MVVQLIIDHMITHTTSKNLPEPHSDFPPLFRVLPPFIMVLFLLYIKAEMEGVG